MELIIAAFAVLFILLFVIIIKKKKATSAKEYEPRKWLLTKAERSFYGVLQLAIKADALLLMKVRIADVVKPSRKLKGADWQRAFNKIAAKHFDFVVCNPNTLEVLCVIELDDSSHKKPAVIKRDEFVNQVCESAGVPLYRFKASLTYKPHELRATINAVLSPD